MVVSFCTRLSVSRWTVAAGELEESRTSAPACPRKDLVNQPQPSMVATSSDVTCRILGQPSMDSPQPGLLDCPSAALSLHLSRRPGSGSPLGACFSGLTAALSWVTTIPRCPGSTFLWSPLPGTPGCAFPEDGRGPSAQPLLRVSTSAPHPALCPPQVTSNGSIGRDAPAETQPQNPPPQPAPNAWQVIKGVLFR